MTLLRQRMRGDMRVRNLSLSPQTHASYLQHVARFARTGVLTRDVSGS